MDQACTIAMEEARAALERDPALQRIIFTPFGDAAAQLYRETFDRFFP